MIPGTNHIAKPETVAIRRRAVGLFLLFSLTVAPAVLAQARFVEVGAQRGILPFTMAEGPVSGIAAADFDDDGDVDLFVPTGQRGRDQLYVNRGDGVFQESAALYGLDLPGNHRNALWFDYDGDHDLDLVVGGDCRLPSVYDDTPCVEDANLWLYRQRPDGRFEDVTHEAGLDVAWGGRRYNHRSGLAAGDLNRDGLLDLVVTMYWGRAFIFINDGAGGFVDVLPRTDPVPVERGYQQPIIADLDGDGWQDIFATFDGGPNLLWLNRHDGTFEDVAAAAGVDNARADMGVDLADFDNDGDLDLYITNIFRNVFFVNESTPEALHFVERSAQLGVDDGGWGWGATFIDIDNDGWLDLAETNGHRTPIYRFDRSRMFYNPGRPGSRFIEIGRRVGFDDTEVGSSLIAVDTDRDGDLDLLQICGLAGRLRLLENRPDRKQPRGRYLVVRPRMAGPNHRAIGAVVRVTTGPVTRMRLITAGKSTVGQEPAEAFFGLGDSRGLASVVVEWPDGRVSTLTGVALNQVLTVSDAAAR